MVLAPSVALLYRYLQVQSLRRNLLATLGGSGESEPCLVLSDDGENLTRQGSFGAPVGRIGRSQGSGRYFRSPAACAVALEALADCLDQRYSSADPDLAVLRLQDSRTRRSSGRLAAREGSTGSDPGMSGDEAADVDFGRAGGLQLNCWAVVA